MAGMVEAGFVLSGITGVLNSAGAGRLRPAGSEEGLGLIWDAEAPALPLLPIQHGLPAALPMAEPVPFFWHMPPAWDAFLWSSMAWGAPAWAAEVHANPERHSAPDDIRLPPGLLPDVPIWLPPDVPVTEPEAEGTEAGAVPPRPSGLPEPLFAPPVLEGGAARQVSVPGGQADAIHQPGVTDRPPEGLGWRITGGADAALLLMDPAAGTLRFLTAPDAAQPADPDRGNRYEVIFEVRDGWGAAATQHLTITVEDAVWA
jgi:hypothetical protein